MRYALVAAVLTLAAGTAVAVGYLAIADVTAVTEHRTHVVRGDASRIVVDAADGDVDVRATSSGGVTVRETRRSWLREPELRMALRDGVLDIAVDCPSLSPGCGDDLEITAPRDVRLAQVDVDSGDVSVTGLASGRVVARSDSGDVEVAVPTGRYRIDAEADSGEVEVERVLRDDLAGRRIDARADSGDVVVRGG